MKGVQNQVKLIFGHVLQGCPYTVDFGHRQRRALPGTQGIGHRSCTAFMADQVPMYPSCRLRSFTVLLKLG